MPEVRGLEQIYDELLRSVRAREAVVLATVVETKRSVPRHAGAKMLVYADGSTSGTIGGGEMEARVIAAALGALADRCPTMVSFSLVDPRVGDPGVCGGDVQLYLEPHMPPSTVYVIGCGHVGRAVVELAHWMGFRVVATDDRADAVSAETVPLAHERVAGSVAEAITAVPVTSDSHVVVVTRNMGLDVAALPLLVGTPARSIGVMGSKRRWTTTRRRLLDEGMREDDLARVRAPIGLELNAETPEEIAVSILAEIVAIERAATGAPMSLGAEIDSPPASASSPVPAESR